jgi:hypothetical protein
VRTRTTILQAQTHHFLGTFGSSGNADYRGELKRALQVITSYAAAHQLLLSQIVVQMSGLYGNAAVLREVLDHALGIIGRSRDYALLDLAVVQAVLACPPAQVCTHPESGALRCLYDCASCAPRRRWTMRSADCRQSPSHSHENLQRARSALA